MQVSASSRGERPAFRTDPVDRLEGKKLRPQLPSINSNSKVPAMVADDRTRIFDGGTILLYLAEKSGHYQNPRARRGKLSHSDEYRGQEWHPVHRLSAAVCSRAATHRALALKNCYRFKSDMDTDSLNARSPHFKKQSDLQ